MGIESLSTHQYASQLSVISEGNLRIQFAKCKVGLAVKGVNKEGGLTFLNNWVSSCTIGIGIEGASNYEVSENKFFNNYLGMHLRNTANLDVNYLFCNDFETSRCCDIYADGRQGGIWMDGNDFIYSLPPTINFYLTGNAASPGEVGGSLSGQSTNPVKNFFHYPESSIITEGATEFFEYRHEPGASSFYLPLCDIDDSGCAVNNNFENREALGEVATCVGGRPAPDFPTITNENVSYQPLKRQLGYHLYQQDYAAAQQIIASLPSATNADMLYRQVQEINLAQLSQDDFILTTGQTQFLDSVSRLNLPDVSPYADGVLRTSNPNDLNWPVPICPRSGGRMQQPVLDGGAASVKISPNPADAVLEVRSETAQGPVDVELTDLLGTVLRRAVLFGSTPVAIETSALPSGIYLLRTTAEGQAAQAQKVIIQH